jgi:hypothetical protein
MVGQEKECQISVKTLEMPTMQSQILSTGMEKGEKQPIHFEIPNKYSQS